MPSKWKGRGGARKKTGIPSQWQHPETVTIRLPAVFAHQLRNTVARAIDTAEDDPIAAIQRVAEFLVFPAALQQQLIFLGQQIEADEADSIALVREAIDYAVERQGF